MKIGLTYWLVDELSAHSISSQARFGESLGFDSFWLPENHFNEIALPDPLMLLSAVSATTSSIKLGTSSYLLPLRNPLMAAEQVAILDNLSHGRLILGVGRGYATGTLKAFNVKPQEKRERFEWCLKIMLEAWAGKGVSLNDEFTPVTVKPLPIQEPHPPIWIAAFGPKALRQAGRLGLPYIASPIETQSQLIKNLKIFSNAAEEAGHSPIETRPVMRSIFICDNKTELDEIKRAMSKAHMPPGLETSQNINDWSIIGEKDYVFDKIQEYREILGITDLIVTRLRLTKVSDKRFRRSLEQIVSLLA